MLLRLVWNSLVKILLPHPSNGAYRANAQRRLTSAEVLELQSSDLHFSTGVVLPYAEEGATDEGPLAFAYSRV